MDLSHGLVASDRMCSSSSRPVAEEPDRIAFPHQYAPDNDTALMRGSPPAACR
jgi:hypothetical protein